MIQRESHDAAPLRSQSEVEQASAIDPVLFERLLSYRPQISELVNGREPPLRDIIFSYYFRFCDEEAANKYTKAYIDELYRVVGGAS